METLLSLRKTFAGLVATLVMLAAMVPLHASANLVSTEEVVIEQQRVIDRDHLARELDRSEVRSELERFGVDPGHAQERVAAMTDAEVQQLTAGLDQFAAGGDVAISLTTILLIILIVILLN